MIQGNNFTAHLLDCHSIRRIIARRASLVIVRHVSNQDLVRTLIIVNQQAIVVSAQASPVMTRGPSKAILIKFSH